MSTNSVADLVADDLEAVSPATPQANQLIAEAAGQSPPATPAAPPPPPPPGLDDPSNFDPRIHQADKKGKAVLTKEGKLRRKAGVKPATMPPPAVVTATTAPIAAAPMVNEAVASAAAKKMVALIVAVGVSVGGEEFKPMPADTHPLQVDEREFMEECWKDYFAATGTIDMPPWLMLLVGMGMYIMPRWQMPHVKARILATFGTKKPPQPASPRVNMKPPAAAQVIPPDPPHAA